MNTILIDNHIHTWRCGHASGDVNDIAETALSRGLSIITLNEHAPIPREAESFCRPNIHMKRDELPRYIEAVQRAKEEYQEKNLSIRLGLELDHFSQFPEWEAHANQLLSLDVWDSITGSIHFAKMNGKHVFLWLFDQTHCDYFQDCYFAGLTEAIESKRYHIIAHPELIWITGLSHSPKRRSRAERQFVDMLSVAARCGVAIECNGSGFQRSVYSPVSPTMIPPTPDLFPFPRRDFFDEVCRKGVAVSTGSDAHAPRDVGESCRRSREFLLSAGITSTVSFRRGALEVHPL